MPLISQRFLTFRSENAVLLQYLVNYLLVVYVLRLLMARYIIRFRFVNLFDTNLKIINKTHAKMINNYLVTQLKYFE